MDTIKFVKTGFTRSNLEKKAKDRNNWKTFVCGFCCGGEATGIDRLIMHEVPKSFDMISHYFDTCNNDLQ